MGTNWSLLADGHMADFNVTTRIDYRDISGAVLDVVPFGQTVSGGQVIKWKNVAFNTAVKRFADLYLGASPYFNSSGGSRFVRSIPTHLPVTRLGSVMYGNLTEAIAPTQKLAFAFKIDPLFTSDDQGLLSSGNNTLDIWVQNSGRFGVTTQVVNNVFAGSRLPSGPSVNLVAWNDNNSFDWYINNGLSLSGVSANVSFPSFGHGIRVGCDHVVSNLDSVLFNLTMWTRVLSSMERDFLFSTYGGFNVSSGIGSDPRALMSVEKWGDGTGNLTQRQVRRVNPRRGAEHMFALAKIPAGHSAGIVQFSCETDGVTKPDSELLDGNLYAINFIEKASFSNPTVVQDTGWSSIFDVRFATPGHYTMLFERLDHGSRYVHLDVGVES